VVSKVALVVTTSFGGVPNIASSQPITFVGGIAIIISAVAAAALYLIEHFIGRFKAIPPPTPANQQNLGPEVWVRMIIP
jgi:hypothetical protein